MDYGFTANFEDQLDKVAEGELEWKSVLDSFYSAFKKDLTLAFTDEGMRKNTPTQTDITCSICSSNTMVIRNSGTGVFLGCNGYNNEGEDKCKGTLNLISGDEAISLDDQDEASNLMKRERCHICGTSMDNFLMDETRKLHVCGNNPDCSGYKIEQGAFKLKGYDGPLLECHKCGAEMQLNTGKFGKYFLCLNDNCKTTRNLQRNGEPKPIVMETILSELACEKFEDHYLLRDSMKGLFLAASKYPKNRETRAPKLEEFISIVTEDSLMEACRYLKDPKKHFYLLSGPLKDKDKNPYVIRYNKAEDTHYLASEKDGKKTKWTAVFDNNEWREQLKK